jgi:hypothetical protein
MSETPRQALNPNGEQQKIQTGFPLESKPAIDALKRVVDAVGADWCGVQDTIQPDVSLLLFNSRTTGSTLAVPFNPLSFNTGDLYPRVLKRLQESDATFSKRRVSVKYSDLERLHKTASKIAEELGIILGGKDGKRNRQ